MGDEDKTTTTEDSDTQDDSGVEVDQLVDDIDDIIKTLEGEDEESNEEAEPAEDKESESEDDDLDKILGDIDKDDDKGSEKVTSILDEAEGGTDEDDFSLPEGFEDMSKEEQDNEIFLALEDDKSWDAWRGSAKEVHGEVDRSFAVDALKADMTPEFLSERGLYSLKDFTEYIKSTEAKIDPKALILADPDDEEQVSNFLDEHIGIPKDKDGYDKEIFIGTKYEGNEALQDYFLTKAVSRSFTQEQALGAIRDEEAIAKELEVREARELDEFKDGEKKHLAKVYGTSANAISKDVFKALRSTPQGKIFIDKYRDSKALMSHEFVGAIFNLLNYKGEGRSLGHFANPADKLTQREEKVSKLSDEKLLQWEQKLDKVELIRADVSGLTPKERAQQKRLIDLRKVVHNEKLRRA